MKETRMEEAGGSDATRMEGGGNGGGALAAEFYPGYEFRGSRLLEAVRTDSGEAVLWKVERGGRRLALKVYHHGKAPKSEVVEIMRSLPKESVVEILEAGEERGQFYEFLEWMEHGSLADWAKREKVGERQVRELLGKMVGVLGALHGMKVIHRDIKPANLLVRSVVPGLDVVLTDFGISSVAAVSKHVTSAHRTPAYSAPEAVSGVVKTSSDWWSVGVIALELLEGRHPFEGTGEMAMSFELVTRGIAVPTDLGKDWQLLLKGLLSRDADRRWGAKEVERWLAGEQDLPVFYEEGVDAGGRDTRPYKLAGKEYLGTEALAIGLVEHWEEGVKRVLRGDVCKWVEEQIGDQDLVNALKDILEDEGLAFEQKLAVSAVVMNPKMPLVWRGELVGKEWLERYPGEGRRLLFSRVPEWMEERKGESDLLRWRNSISWMEGEIQTSGIPVQYDADTAWRLMFRGESGEMLWEEVAKVRMDYGGAKNEVLRRYLTSPNLEVWQAILLVTCDKKMLVRRGRERKEKQKPEPVATEPVATEPMPPGMPPTAFGENAEDGFWGKMKRGTYRGLFFGFFSHFLLGLLLMGLMTALGILSMSEGDNSRPEIGLLVFMVVVTGVMLGIVGAGVGAVSENFKGSGKGLSGFGLGVFLGIFGGIVSAFGFGLFGWISAKITDSACKFFCKKEYRK